MARNSGSLLVQNIWAQSLVPRDIDDVRSARLPVAAEKRCSVQRRLEVHDVARLGRSGIDANGHLARVVTRTELLAFLFGARDGAVHKASDPRCSTKVTLSGMVVPCGVWVHARDSGRKPTMIWLLSAGVIFLRIEGVSSTLASPEGGNVTHDAPLTEVHGGEPMKPKDEGVEGSGTFRRARPPKLEQAILDHGDAISHGCEPRSDRG